MQSPHLHVQVPVLFFADVQIPDAVKLTNRHTHNVTEHPNTGDMM